MNQFYCETEKEIIDALRCGSLHSELKTHARGCPICSDTLAVSEFLQANSTSAPVLPDADFIWWKTQLMGKQMAMERATRSILFVRKITYLSVGAVLLWLVFAPGHLRSIMNSLARYGIWSTGGIRESALLMGFGALAVTLLCSLYLARSEKHS